MAVSYLTQAHNQKHVKKFTTGSSVPLEEDVIIKDEDSGISTN